MTIDFSEKISGGKWRNGRYVDTTKVYKRFTVTGETEEECFKKIYTGYERSLRYCSGYYIELDDPQQHDRYQGWKQHGVTIEMYYGNGTVD